MRSTLHSIDLCYRLCKPGLLRTWDWGLVLLWPVRGWLRVLGVWEVQELPSVGSVHFPCPLLSLPLLSHKLKQWLSRRCSMPQWQPETKVDSRVEWGMRICEGYSLAMECSNDCLKKSSENRRGPVRGELTEGEIVKCWMQDKEQRYSILHHLARGGLKYGQRKNR